MWKILKSYKPHLYEVDKFIAYCDREISVINQDANRTVVKNRSAFYKSYARQMSDQIAPLVDGLLKKYNAMARNTISKAVGLYLNNLKNQIEDWKLLLDVLGKIETSIID